MRWIGYLLIFLFFFSIAAHAQKGGYTEDSVPTQNGPIDTSGADATISFRELPLWIQIAYISGIILAFLGLFKSIPIVIGRIKNLLENQNRQGIFKYILNNPGCTIAEISGKQEINRGSVKYHINKLKSEEKISFMKKGKFLRLFQNSGAFKDNEQKMAGYLKNETSRLILWKILENPGITNQELTDKFEVDKSTIHWHIQQFRNDNIVVFEQEGKYKRNYINTEAETILLRFMPHSQSNLAQV